MATLNFSARFHSAIPQIKSALATGWKIINQPFIVGVVLTLGLPFFYQQFSEHSTKMERVDKADLQIASTLYFFKQRLNDSKTCEEIADAVLGLNKPNAIYPDFKEMPFKGVLLDLWKNLPEEKSKLALYPAYEAATILEALEPSIRKACNPESSKKLINGQLFYGAFNARPWFNFPQFYEKATK